VSLIAVTPASAQYRERWDGGVKPRGERLFRDVMLRDHNAARDAVGVAPLVWDDDLARTAAAYAGELARTNRFQHAPREPGQRVEGENLWMGTRTAYRYEDMLGTWTGEARHFRNGQFPQISRTGNWADVGHYSQIIWSTTRAVGCAIAANGANEYLVCRYFPAGNVWGQSAYGR
jgi:uncharacterized protein YkwD